MIFNKNYSIPTPPCENLNRKNNVMLNLFQHLRDYETLKRVQGDRTSFYALYSKSAFTLAEVLITLVIIGVIAAITVPTLITKYQKEQTVTRLKKAYSTLAQTTQKAIADNGPIETWELYWNTTGIDAQMFFQKYLKPYLSISRDCGLNITGVCEFKYSFLNDNTSSGSYDQNHHRFYLQDGTLVALLTYADDNSNSKHVFVYIDINGQKKPNKYGKDLFLFDYNIQTNNLAQNGKLIPYGNGNSREYLLSGTTTCHCNKSAGSHAGQYCAAVIMKDGWQIKDDYPW